MPFDVTLRDPGSVFNILIGSLTVAETPMGGAVLRGSAPALQVGALASGGSPVSVAVAVVPRRPPPRP